MPLIMVFNAMQSDRPAYPSLSPAQVRDWPRFLSALQGTDPGTSELRNFWLHLPAAQRAVMQAIKDVPTADVQSSICLAITKTLRNPAVFEPPPAETVQIATVGTAAPIRPSWPENRRRLDQLLQGVIGQDPRLWGWYEPLRWGYSITYGLVTCLLVFGTLGCFQALCSGNSPVWRYISDSA